MGLERKHAVRNLLCALLLAAPLTANAEPSRVDIAVAKKLFEEASQAEAAERWQEARDKLGRVLAIKETAGVRFHFALAEEKTGLLLAAKRDYRRAVELAEALPESERANILQLSSSALATLEPKVPTLTVTAAATPKLVVSIDGQTVDRAALAAPIAHELGEVKVTATAPGYQPFEKSLILIAGDHQTVVIEMRAEASAPVVVASGEAAPIESPRPKPESRGVSVAGIVAASTAVVLAGGATYFLLRKSSLDDETADVCSHGTVLCDRAERDARAAQYRNYAIGAGIGAVVAAGAATFFFLRSPRGESVALGASPGSVSLRLKF